MSKGTTICETLIPEDVTLHKFLLTILSSISTFNGKLVRKYHFSCDAKSLEEMLFSIGAKSVEKFVDFYYKPEWLRVRVKSQKGIATYKDITNVTPNGELEYLEFTDESQIEQLIYGKEIKLLQSLNTTRVTFFKEAEMEIYVDVVKENEQNRFIIAGGISIIIGNNLNETRDRFSSLVSLWGQKGFTNNIIHPTKSKIVYIDKREDIRNNPIETNVNPLDSYLISCSDTEEKIRTWAQRLKEGKYTNYIKEIKNGWELRKLRTQDEEFNSLLRSATCAVGKRNEIWS